MWKKIDQYVAEHQMIDQGEQILLGLSGGADSILLARYLLHLRDMGRIDLFAVHVNHMIREEEALRDEAFVIDFCRKWEIPYRSFRKDVRDYAHTNKMSVEEAGREIRYKCMEEVSDDLGCKKIALAHHAGDLAETMLFRMARGTGPAGLIGILPVNGMKIRPLLCVDKGEILGMLKVLEQDYVEDSSNQDIHYRRNHVRHRILTEMKEINPQAVNHMLVLSRQMQEQEEYVQQQMDRRYDELVTMQSDSVYARKFSCADMLTANDKDTQRSCEYPIYKVNAQKLAACTIFEQKEILRRMLFAACQAQKDIGAVHLEAVRELLWKPSGKRICLPYQVEARRNQDDICIGKYSCEKDTFLENESLKAESDPGKSAPCRIKMPSVISEIPLEDIEEEKTYRIPLIDIEEKSYRIPLADIEEEKSCKIPYQDKISLEITLIRPNQIENIKNHCIKYFDYDKIKGTLYMRTRQDGDYFVMDDQGRQKKLNRYYIDKKIPLSDRDHNLLLAEGNHVVWVTDIYDGRYGYDTISQKDGGRISSYYKVTKETKRVLQATFIKG